MRGTKRLGDSVLARMSRLFDQLYAAGLRPSVPPEYQPKSSLFAAFCVVRSERPSCEQLSQGLLFEWFLDLNLEDEPFHPTTFMKHCDRFLESDVNRMLLTKVVRVPRRHRLLSSGHFAVDRTLLDAWASHRCYRPRDESRRRQRWIRMTAHRRAPCGAWSSSAWRHYAWPRTRCSPIRRSAGDARCSWPSATVHTISCRTPAKPY